MMSTECLVLRNKQCVAEWSGSGSGVNTTDCTIFSLFSSKNSPQFSQEGSSVPNNRIQEFGPY